MLLSLSYYYVIHIVRICDCVNVSETFCVNVSETVDAYSVVYRIPIPVQYRKAITASLPDSQHNHLLSIVSATP